MNIYARMFLTYGQNWSAIFDEVKRKREAGERIENVRILRLITAARKAKP